MHYGPNPAGPGLPLWHQRPAQGDPRVANDGGQDMLHLLLRGWEQQWHVCGGRPDPRGDLLHLGAQVPTRLRTATRSHLRQVDRPTSHTSPSRLPTASTPGHVSGHLCGGECGCLSRGARRWPGRQDLRQSLRTEEERGPWAWASCLPSLQLRAA